MLKLSKINITYGQRDIIKDSGLIIDKGKITILFILLTYIPQLIEILFFSRKFFFVKTNYNFTGRTEFHKYV